MSKIINAVTWGAVGQVLKMSLKFSVSIVLAKLLSPDEFGLMGKLTILLAILNTLCNFGLSTSLIQKKDASPQDFSTVFWINILIGAALTLALYTGSGQVAKFYNSPELTHLGKALSVNFILHSLIIVHQAILTKNLRFKQLEIYTFCASLLASLIGLYMAFNNYGVWSLVAQTLSYTFFMVCFCWLFEPWRPGFLMKLSSLKKLSGFGSYMAASNILDLVFSNLDSILIGRYFSSTIMGFYVYSQTLIKNLLTILAGPVFKVLFPALASVHDDNQQIRFTYKKFVGMVNFVVLPAMIFIAIMAGPISKIMLNDKWAGISTYLSYFAIIGIVYNYCAINVSIITAKGKGKLFFRLEILKKAILSICLFFGFKYGIYGIMNSVIFFWLINMLLDVYFSGRISEYPWSQQLKDLIPNAVVAIIYGLILFLMLSFYTSFSYTFTGLLFFGVCGMVIYLLLSYLFKLNALVVSVEVARKILKNGS